MEKNILMLLQEFCVNNIHSQGKDSIVLDKFLAWNASQLRILGLVAMQSSYVSLKHVQIQVRDSHKIAAAALLPPSPSIITSFHKRGNNWGADYLFFTYANMLFLRTNVSIGLSKQRLVLLIQNLTKRPLWHYRRLVSILYYNRRNINQ